MYAKYTLMNNQINKGKLKYGKTMTDVSLKLNLVNNLTESAVIIKTYTQIAASNLAKKLSVTANVTSFYINIYMSIITQGIEHQAHTMLKDTACAYNIQH